MSAVEGDFGQECAGDASINHTDGCINRWVSVKTQNVRVHDVPSFKLDIGLRDLAGWRQQTATFANLTDFGL